MILGAYPIGRVPIGFGALLFFAPAVLDPTRRFVNELAGEDYVLRGRFYRSVVVGEEILAATRVAWNFTLVEAVEQLSTTAQ